MTPRTVAPTELTSSGVSGSPRRLRVHPEHASTYASRLNLRHVGPDFDIDSFRPLSALDDVDRYDSHPLTYLSARALAAALEGRKGLTVVTTPELQAYVPPENGVILTASRINGEAFHGEALHEAFHNDAPRNAFYSIMGAAQTLGFLECLETHVSRRANISPTSVISPNVYVSDHTEIGPGAVVLPNTYLGPGVVVKPNAVIGGDGFEAMGVELTTHEAAFGRQRRIVPHAGGVWLSEGVQVGSCTSIDKGLFGDFTVVGSYTLIDNLVHFAHSARAGKFCSIIACAEVSGSVVLGDGVWVGPNASINQGLRIAEHCYIGTGSVVTRDLAAYSLAYGSPAKSGAWVCSCRTKISFEEARTACSVCGKEYVLTDGRVQRK